ncbi:bifunctional alpha/beta hydrolase/OsmC family protein [Janibacter sp. GS2]|uniref:bifunctional alpha/beta hydrolase/OsmC family protein n=1 Tax=Janibacter sp. GS2 TaxID=3442646 RepID=UPI003EB7E54E
MHSEKVTFPGSGGTPLAGRLDLPDGQPQAFALFAHCFTCSKDVLAASRIANALTDFGIAVLRFDFTGLGGSGGDFANTNFTSNVADLVNAVDYLRDTHTAPTILIGHSLGGAAVLAAAQHIPEVRAVATIGAPADTEHLMQLLAESRHEIEEVGEAEVCLAARTFRIRRQFLEDISHQPQTDRISRLGAALLVMHSPVDETVGVDNARSIFDAARHPKSFVSLDGADHLLTRAADARFAASVLAAWASRYLDEEVTGAPDAAAPAGVDAEQGLVVVSENGRGPYGQRITAGGHLLNADEPTPVGHDTGPSPYDLLLAGLGACTSMTLRMYATRKGWPLESVSVSLRHSRMHAADCAECETRAGQLDRVERTVRLTGDLDDEQRQRLLEIADQCPVHRTLHSEVDVRTTLASHDTHPDVAEDRAAGAPT